ncbi:MAG: hypothetical protein ACRYHA_04030 [Janthinobacterium lividum]
MTRRIEQDLVVELNWETLLGVDQERREIGDLCARRGASHHVVFTDDFGLRAVGLVARAVSRAGPGPGPGLDPEPEPDSDPDFGTEAAPAYALAGILAGRSDGRPLVFLHALDDAKNHVAVIAVKAGRPEIDRVLPLADALREAERFIETLDDPCRLCGTHPVPGKAVETMPLPGGPTLSDAERSAYRITRLRTGITRHVPTPRARRTLALAVLGLAVIGTGAGIAKMLRRRPAAPAVPRAEAAPDPLALHRQHVARTLARELAAPGHAPAVRMVALLRDLPIAPARWRMSRMECAGDGCAVLWRRRPGGTLDGLLDARPAAQPMEEDVDQATERLALPDHPAPAFALTLQKREHFYRIANSRAQRLRDAGLAMELGPTAPIVTPPPGVTMPASVAASVAVPAKGAWTMSGPLAFVDSVPGLLGRTGNMRVRELVIETEPPPVRFRAAGEFYVE